MVFPPISSNAARQFIDASTVWREYLRSLARARPYEGGMYWKKEGPYEYLIRTKGRNEQERLGARSPQTEAIYSEFHANKAAKEHRLSAICEALDSAQRQNKALRVGQVPRQVEEVLNALRTAGVDQQVVVLGASALWAYSFAAGVDLHARIKRGSSGDLFALARKRLCLHTTVPAPTLAAILAFVGFGEAGDRALEVFVDTKGFLVEVVRTALPSERGEGVSASVFAYPIVSSTGRMATMRVVPPDTFIDPEYEDWLSDLKGELLGQHIDSRHVEVVRELYRQGLVMAQASIETSRTL